VNVSCPECRSVFRVDPARVPPSAVRARCSVCGGVITISSGASMDDEFSSNSSASVATARTVSASERAAAARGNAGFAAAVMDGFAAPPVAAGNMAPPSPAPTVSAPELTRAASADGAPPPLRTGVPPTVQAPSRQAPPPSNAAPSPAPPTAAGGQGTRPVLFPPRPMIPGGASTGAPSRPLVAPRPIVNPPAPAPSQSAPPRSSGSVSADTTIAPARASAPIPTVSNPPASAPQASPSGTPAPARTPINPFLANDPHAKAKRLARALISDLVTYFPQKRQDGLRDGTLKQLFKEEIQKSYEEYVAQVGKEFAESTPHFQDALNDLLAGGQKAF
jgi:predicted Zn finger-like uncharacterized protein